MSTTPAAATQQPLLIVLEEDDEFQEFEELNWTKKDADHVSKQWQDDWDVNDTDDDFCNQLRQELEKNKQQ